MTAQELAQHQHDEDLRAVLSTGAGRRILWWLVDDVGRLHAASYSVEMTHQSAYLEGRRSVAIDLVREAMRVAPLQYAQTLLDSLEVERLKAEATKAKASE